MHQELSAARTFGCVPGSEIQKHLGRHMTSTHHSEKPKSSVQFWLWKFWCHSTKGSSGTCIRGRSMSQRGSSSLLMACRGAATAFVSTILFLCEFVKETDLGWYPFSTFNVDFFDGWESTRGCSDVWDIYCSITFGWMLLADACLSLLYHPNGDFDLSRTWTIAQQSSPLQVKWPCITESYYWSWTTSVKCIHFGS